MYIEEKSSHFEVKEMCIWVTYRMTLKIHMSSLCLGFIRHKTGIIMQTEKFILRLIHNLQNILGPSL